jgi:hypothetical protein
MMEGPEGQIHLFLGLWKGYAKHHETSRHDLHVCRKVFDPQLSLPAWLS